MNTGRSSGVLSPGLLWKRALEGVVSIEGGSAIGVFHTLVAPPRGLLPANALPALWCLSRSLFRASKS